MAHLTTNSTKSHPMKRYALLFFFCLAISTFLQAGGPWPQPKNRGFFKIGQWWVIADQHYTDVGLIDPNITNGIFNTSLYAEYGFTDRLTGVLYFPFYSRAYFNNTVSGTTGEVLTEGEAINGIGDTDIAIQYGLIVNKPVVLSARLLFGLPLGNEAGGTAGNLQTGDGEFNQMIQLDAGTSFKIAEANAYAQVYSGFNNRSNGFSDEFRFGVEGGVSFLKNKLTTTLRLIGILSLKNGDSDDIPNSTSLFANNSEHITFAPEVAYNINEKWGVSAGVGSALWGRIIFANTSFNAGVYFNL